MDSTTLPHHPGSRISQYIALTKPRVTQLAVFCAVIGMFLSTPGMVPWKPLIGGTIGIWLLAAGAFAINCLVEQKIDAKMRRTAWRPSARGEITTTQILVFSAVLGSLGQAAAAEVDACEQALMEHEDEATQLRYATALAEFADAGIGGKCQRHIRLVAPPLLDQRLQSFDQPELLQRHRPEPRQDAPVVPLQRLDLVADRNRRRA